ncbi:MAG: methyltransferase domain-containing protein [Actinomycetota bacterium]
MARLLSGVWADSVGIRRPPGPYFIKKGYQARAKPEYTQELDDDVIWQPDVYAKAAELGADAPTARIIDVGCGDGRKLAALHPGFEIVGIDYGPNLARCRDLYPFGTWLEHDLESEGPLPLSAEELGGSVIVCADVVEHLVNPERMLRAFAAALETSYALVISTPERNLHRGARHMGPPPNPAHVREWSIAEFSSFLAAQGLRNGRIGLTRSNDLYPLQDTILAVLDPEARYP